MKSIKLTLKRDTLLRLTEQEAQAVNGGVIVWTKNNVTCDFTDRPLCNKKV